jgi:hypothetical protein
MLIASVAFAGPSRPQKEMFDRSVVATEVAAANQLALETSAAFDKAVLNVSGPKNFKIRREYTAGQAIAVDLTEADFVDGRYRYSLRVSPKTDSGAVKMGMFFVENGAIVSRDSKRAQLDTIRERLNVSRREKFQEAADKLGSKREGTPGSRPEGVRPSRNESRAAPSPGGYYYYYGGGLFGGYVGIFGYGPLLYFYEIPGYYYYPRNSATPGPAGYAPPYGITGMMMQYYGTNYRLSEYANYDYAYYNVHSAYYNINIGYGNYNYGFINYTQGYANIRNAYFYNSDFGYANYKYALYGPNVSISYGVDFGYGFYGGYNVIIGAGYDLYNYSFEFQPLVIGPRGVGVGTYLPTADFEISDYGYAAMRLYSYSGATRFAFSATPLGVFTVNQVGTGGQEFTVSERFDANGPTVDVQGSVRGTQFIASSSRELKTDFATLDGKQVLSKLSEVPVMSWRYKNEDDSVRHFGPVAEDFRAAFQLGDGQTISNVDADGVTMAAIQGLHQLLEEQQSALEQKDQEMADLRKRLAALEALVRDRSPGDS